MNVIYLLCSICITTVFYVKIGKSIMDEIDSLGELNKILRWTLILLWPILATVFVIIITFASIYSILGAIYCLFK